VTNSSSNSASQPSRHSTGPTSWWWFLLHAGGAILAAAAILFLEREFPVLYMHFILEDSAGEYAGAAGFFIAAVFLALAARRRRVRWVRILLWVAAIVAVVVGLEEMSWGQRILGLETPPALREVNVQSEITLHNISGIDPDLLQRVLAVPPILLVLLSEIRAVVHSRRTLPTWARELPLMPRELYPWALLAATVLLARPFIKSDEVGEFLLGWLVAGWAASVYLDRSHHDRLRGQRRILAAQFAAVILGVAFSTLHRPVDRWRANITAFRDYPSRGLYVQALEVAEYIRARPWLTMPDTEDRYRSLLEQIDAANRVPAPQRQPVEGTPPDAPAME
jgi:hypothetical protein